MDYEVLLHGFDEPMSYSFPMAFDYDELRKAVDDAQELLEQRLEARLALDASPQDASFFGDLSLPTRHAQGAEDAAGDAAQPRIRFSNFGWMATILDRDALGEQTDRVVLKTLADAGFLFIPESELHATYAGQLPESWGVANWKTRFFGYL